MLWSDAISTARVTSIINPVDYGLPALTPITMDIFPQLYGADKNDLLTAGSTNVNNVNSIYYDILPIDSFKIDNTTKLPIYTGYTNWLSTSDPANLGPDPMTNGYPPYGTQFIDWDNQANNMALAAPTPDASLMGANVFFRSAPGDSTRIQLFVKNHATAMFPIAASDQPFGSGLLEKDPYDIKQFTLVPPAPAPVGVPAFVGIGRALCTHAPATYPALGTLNFLSLDNYNKCNFKWHLQIQVTMERSFIITSQFKIIIMQHF